VPVRRDVRPMKRVGRGTEKGGSRAIVGGMEMLLGLRRVSCSEKRFLKA
jgi:hypothetical protein